MRKEINIFGGYNKSHVVDADPRELMNLYVSKTSAGLSLLNTPGMSLSNGLKIYADGGIRKLFVSGDTMHVVGGNVIYRVDKSLNHSFGLELDTDSGYIGIAENEYQILFVDGVSGYIYDKTTQLYSKIIDPAFTESPSDCAYLAGRFIVIKKDSIEWYYSGINDATDWDLNNRYEMTSYADTLEAIEVLHNRLYVFGQKHTEIWYAQISSENPFGEDEAALLEFGIVSRETLAKEEDVMCWIAKGDQGVTSVVRTIGGSLARISNDAIESELQSYESPSDASSFIYTINGNTFYQANFTTDNKSWIYNFRTKSWSQLTAESFDRHRANTHAFFNQKHFVGDYEQLNIYDFSDLYDEDEIEENSPIAIRRKMIANKEYFNEGSGFCVDRIKILARQGSGAESGQDKIPYIECKISRDGGQCYGKTLSSKMGAIGRREWRTDFYRLGTMDSITLELQFYNKVKFALFKVILYISGFEE